MQVPTQPQARKNTERLKECRGQRAEGHLRPAGPSRGACHEDRYLYREWKEDGDPEVSLFRDLLTRGCAKFLAHPRLVSNRRCLTLWQALSFCQASCICDDQEKNRTFLTKKRPGIDIFLIFARKGQRRFAQGSGSFAATGSLHGSLLARAPFTDPCTCNASAYTTAG